MIVRLSPSDLGTKRVTKNKNHITNNSIKKSPKPTIANPKHKAQWHSVINVVSGAFRPDTYHDAVQ